MITRRSFIASSAAFAAAGCASFGDNGGAANAPRFEFGPDGKFTFLHLTDLHLNPNGRRLHPRVERVLRAAFAKHAPSLLVLTGDNVNGQNGDVNAHGKFEEAVDPMTDLFREAGIPFCVTFGNHDSELKGPDRFSRQEQYDYYKSRGGELFVDHDVPELHGVGSGVVSLFERGARRPSFNLFVMDSGDYPEKTGPDWPGYEGCQTDQIAWYERVSGKTPCLWFQHIIVPDVNIHGLFVDAPPCADPKAKEGPETGYRMDCPVPAVLEDIPRRRAHVRGAHALRQLAQDGEPQGRVLRARPHEHVRRNGCERDTARHDEVLHVRELQRQQHRRARVHRPPGRHLRNLHLRRSRLLTAGGSSRAANFIRGAALPLKLWYNTP